MAPPLVTLLSAEPEIQFVALRNIELIVQRVPELLSHEVKVFFCKYNDPIYVKMEKLEIMIKLANESNIDQVLLEFKEYATEVDVDFVRKSVRAIGRYDVWMCWMGRWCVGCIWCVWLWEEHVCTHRCIYTCWCASKYTHTHQPCTTNNNTQHVQQTTTPFLYVFQLYYIPIINTGAQSTWRMLLSAVSMCCLISFKQRSTMWCKRQW